MGNDQHTIRSASEVNTLVIDDPVLAHGFIQLPKLVLYATNVSRDAKLLYAVLLGYAWQEDNCFPGYKKLCTAMQASENMVRKYMRQLEAAGLISQRRRGLCKSNVYTLRDLGTSKIAVQEPQETEDKEEAEEKDANLRNSNADARNKIEPEPKSTTATQTQANQTTHQPLEPNRTASSTPPRNGNLSSLSDILSRMPLAPRTQSNPSLPADSETVPDEIAAYVAEITREMGDHVHTRSNLTYAMRLCQTSGCDPNRFAGILLEARAITRDRRTANRNGTASSQLRRPMAYYWRVVSGLLDPIQTESELKPSSETAETTVHVPHIPSGINPQDTMQRTLTANPAMSQTHLQSPSLHIGHEPEPDDMDNAK
jgi:hypothetical protein